MANPTKYRIRQDGNNRYWVEQFTFCRWISIIDFGSFAEAQDVVNETIKFAKEREARQKLAKQTIEIWEY